MSMSFTRVIRYYTEAKVDVTQEMVCTSLGSLMRPLFHFLCYIHFSLSV